MLAQDVESQRQAPEAPTALTRNAEHTPVAGTATAPAALLQDPLQIRMDLRDFERFPIAKLLKKGMPKAHGQCIDIQHRTREFSERHLLGKVEAWDQKIAEDHGFVPWNVIDAGLEYGFLSMFVPEIFGGEGLGGLPAAVCAEEMAAADAGTYVIYSSHALALSAIAASLDFVTMQRVGREITEGEKRGKAVLLALAYTEPGGGSDVEDRDDIQKARLVSRWTRVAGGYRINARKVFISNGSFSTYTVLTAFGDPSRPLDTVGAFLIPNDAPGFSVGRVEHKMGQRMSAAAEIICDDVFVPDTWACFTDQPGRMIDTTLSLTRGPVGAMATGILRGAIERTLTYLSQKRVRGHWLFEEQWVQLTLAEMIAALQAGRGLYLDAALAGESWGLASMSGDSQVKLPEVVTRSKAFSNWMTHPKTIEGVRKKYVESVPDSELQRVVAHGSISKFMGSDLSVKMCMKAIEILGEDANDPQWGVEKCMRDAKLTQIFEGTNQLNRLHVTRGLLAKK